MQLRKDLTLDPTGKLVLYLLAAKLVVAVKLVIAVKPIFCLG
jgi:hypothetical protein